MKKFLVPCWICWQLYSLAPHKTSSNTKLVPARQPGGFLGETQF